MKRTSMLTVLVSLIFLVPFLGCDQPSQPRSPEEMSVTDIVRVFMHTETYYSALRDVGTPVLEKWRFSTGHADLIRIMTNAKPNESMWIYYKKNSHYTYQTVDIHIHTPSEIEGGGWNHGKHGSGQTNVIE